MAISNLAITITYNLNPPKEISTQHSGNPLSTSRTITTPIVGDAASSATGSDGSSSSKAYYAALHTAIEKARNELGDDLTAWRDRVGKAEAGKEVNLKEPSDDEDEEEDE